MKVHRIFVALLLSFSLIWAAAAQIPLKKFQGFLGTYHPFNGTAYGGPGWKDGELIQNAFQFGQNAILVKNAHNGYTFEENITKSCSEWDVNKVFGILLPPSEFGAVNQPADLGILNPFEKEPGMIQGMSRFSALSKRCPQVAGVIIDDLYNNFPKGMSLENLRDMKDALSGKPVDANGNVDHSAPATTPNLKMYFVVYEHHLDIKPSREVLDLIDGVSFWTWKQTEHFKDLETNIEAVHRLYPNKDVIAGVYVKHSRQVPSVESVHYMIEKSVDLYDRGSVSGLLLFSAIWLAREYSTEERWNDLALPQFLGRTYYSFLGEGTGRVVDARSKTPVEHALVTVNRITGGRRILVTRKFTDGRGGYRFGGWAGKNKSRPDKYEIRVESESYKPSIVNVQLRARQRLRFADVTVKR